jgi:hypothetical protein
VHIAYFFDQSQYYLDFAPRARNLVVSPLVVTYHYTFNERFNSGSIAPSSETEDGIFGDYHYLVQRTGRLPAGQQLRLQHEIGRGPELINGVLREKGTVWLAVADRVLTSYAPEVAIPLGEKRIGQREIAVWTEASIRTVAPFINILQSYNLRPNPGVVADLLRQFGHITAEGLLGIVAESSRADDSRGKGIIGTLIAATWYLRQYPNALIASLDSNLARQWLQNRDDNKRADLIGVRVNDETSEIIIEPIEVKTRATDNVQLRPDAESGQRCLMGEAVDQVKTMLQILDPVFGGEDSQPLFTQARRETIKYQLHRECFRDPSRGRDWMRTWYNRFKDEIFTQPNPRGLIKLRGLIIQIRLEEVGPDLFINDPTQDITLVTLRTNTIQSLISDKPLLEPVEEVEIVEIDHVSDIEQAMSESSEVGGSDNAPDQSHMTIPGRLDAIEYPSVQDSSNVPDSSSEIVELARLFKRACQAYNISIQECDPRRAVIGPNVIRLYVKLASGQRLPALRNALEDIGREMRRSGLLINTIPNTAEVALDIPRLDRINVPLARGLSCIEELSSIEQIPLAIGTTPEGEDIIIDLGDSNMIHMLVGGTTGAGKTMFLYSLLAAMLTTHRSPESLRLMLSSSKLEDFVFFEGLPHLEGQRIITDASEAVRVLQEEVIRVIEERSEVLTAARCRDIHQYNQLHVPQMPPYVVIVDEFADLADQITNRARKEEFYTCLRRIAQAGRSRGVHLVLCTQRPSANLLPTGIRSLMNVRVALRVNDSVSSRMILDETGAEQLQLHGDLLLKELSSITRAQGYFTSVNDLEDIISGLLS